MDENTLQKVKAYGAHCDILTVEQLKCILASLGGSRALLDGVEDLVRAAGCNGDGIKFHAFMEWLFADDVPNVRDNASIEELQRKVADLFSTLSDSSAGCVDANVLAATLMRLDGHNLSEEDIVATLRDVDLNGDGNIDCQEFAKLLEAPAVPAPDYEPHLVLYFDVNQTVLMLDSVTGSCAKSLLNEVVANATWGRMVDEQWQLASAEPQLEAPGEGLVTYCHFIRETTPKKEQRKKLRGFAEKGQPGEQLIPFVEKLLSDLKLPAQVAAEAEPGRLEELGLGGGNFCLLPSFLILIRCLKLCKRSFSLCFRTFGLDLTKIAKEYNALCEDKHPLFSPGSDWAKQARFGLDAENGLAGIVMDGSDGLPDMRLNLSPGSGGLGTWIRGDTGMKLVFGDLRQPPQDRTCSKTLAEFYAESPTSPANLKGGLHSCADLYAGLADNATVDVDIVEGAAPIRDRLRELLHRRDHGCSLALRDYYPAGEESGRTAAGGKPLFVEFGDTSVLQIFWDDHILPNDAHIVDIKHAEHPDWSTPISQVWGVHAVRAQPLASVTDPLYFVKSFKSSEERWRAACRRRRLLGDSLLVAVEQGAKAAQKLWSKGHLEVSMPIYKAHSTLKDVRLQTDINASDSEESSDEGDEDAERRTQRLAADLVSNAEKDFWETRRQEQLQAESSAKAEYWREGCHEFEKEGFL